MPSTPSHPKTASAVLCAVAAYGLVTALLAPPAMAAANPGAMRATPSPQRVTGMMPPGSPDAVTSVTRAALPGASTATAFALGTDVASYQHPSGRPIAWSAVAAAGQSFTVVKATESTTYVNPYLMTDVIGARAAGLLVGLYHFADPTTSATAQADSFARQVNGIGGTMLPPVLDLEVTGGLSSTALISWTSAFLSRVRQDTGRIPMIYTGPYFWGSAMAGSTAFSRYPLWEAHWTTASQPQSIPGWPTWTLWQYSNGTFGSPAAVPGISALVDRDRFNGTRAQLASLASSSRPGVQPPFTGTATSAQFPDATFVQVVGDRHVYEIAGLAPLLVDSWSHVGGPHPVRTVTPASFYTLRSSPLEGTFLMDHADQNVYRVTGGAPVIVTSWAPFGGIRHYVPVDGSDIAYAGAPGPYSHLSSVVRDGTIVSSVETGQVYVVAGGAPVYVSTWATFGGPQPSVGISQAAIDRAGAGGVWNHMRFVPADGTSISDGSTGQLYLVTAGHPGLTTATGPGTTPFTLVDHAAILNAGGTGVWAHLK